MNFITYFPISMFFENNTWKMDRTTGIASFKIHHLPNNYYKWVKISGYAHCSCNVILGYIICLNPLGLCFTYPYFRSQSSSYVLTTDIHRHRVVNGHSRQYVLEFLVYRQDYRDHEHIAFLCRSPSSATLQW